MSQAQSYRLGSKAKQRQKLDLAYGLLATPPTTVRIYAHSDVLYASGELHLDLVTNSREIPANPENTTLQIA